MVFNAIVIIQINNNGMQSLGDQVALTLRHCGNNGAYHIFFL